MIEDPGSVGPKLLFLKLLRGICGRHLQPIDFGYEDASAFEASSFSTRQQEYEQKHKENDFYGEPLT